MLISKVLDLFSNIFRGKNKQNVFTNKFFCLKFLKNYCLLDFCRYKSDSLTPSQTITTCYDWQIMHLLYLL